jgi:SH3-like domain-containing protein
MAKNPLDGISNPLDIIAKGMKINPQITRILFSGVVLVACVALAAQLVKDPLTAIVGGILFVIASVVLILVAAIAQQQISPIAIWFCRFIAALFVAICLTFVTSWAFDKPKPFACLISPMSPCRSFDILPPIQQAGDVCLKPDEHLAVASCGEAEGNYVVTNVRSDDSDRGLHVREKPDIKSTSWGVLKPNTTELAVGTCSSGWCPVQCKGQGLKGWSRDRYLSLRSGVTFTVTGISQAATGLALRNGPAQTCSAVDSIPSDGSNVIIHSCQESPIGTTQTQWCLVTYEKRSGWVPLANLTRQSSQ